MNLHKVNISAGLIVASFVLTHTLNHALGLWSLEAAEGARRLFGLLWRNPVASAALAGAFIVHLALAYYAVYRRSHLRLPVWEWACLIFAFMISFVLVRHVTLSGVIPLSAGVIADYPFIIANMWLIDPTAVVLQGLLFIVVWGHLSIGSHFWFAIGLGTRGRRPTCIRWRGDFLSWPLPDWPVRWPRSTRWRKIPAGSMG